MFPPFLEERNSDGGAKTMSMLHLKGLSTHLLSASLWFV